MKHVFGSGSQLGLKLGHALVAFGALNFFAPAVAHAACGDGVSNFGETCDDGNEVDDDGCSADCQREAGFLCNGAPSLCCFANAAGGFDLIGSAYIDSVTREVILTPDQNGVAGYAWFRNRLDFSVDFSIDLQLYLGDKDQDGADGGSIMFQRDARGAGATGGVGGDLGASGISPLVAVEFDTYDNGMGVGDLQADHTSIFSNTVSNQLITTQCLDVACSDYEDDQYHKFAVSWQATTSTMTVYVDGVLRLTLVNDLVTNYFSGDSTNIMFGFAASTGGARNEQKFCPSAPNGFTVPTDDDGDGVDGAQDQDDDNDGIADSDEVGPGFSGDPSGDHDTDGIQNWIDPDYWTDVLMDAASCPDVVAPRGECDSVPLSVDADSDGLGNHQDVDSDGDGLTDTLEAGLADADADGRPDDCDSVDVNGLCASGIIGSLPNTDGDSPSGDDLPDYKDYDDDGDGIPTRVECRGANPCPDDDDDGIPNNQDLDSDGDGTPDNPCLPDADALACSEGDADGDGLSNAQECPILSACRDTDGDGTADFEDADSDNDGVDDVDDDDPLDACVPSANVKECPTGDFDNDGVPNGEECPTPLSCPDIDGDGAPDYQDPDSDDDGEQDATDEARTNACIPTTFPQCPGSDSDGDGLDNGIECATVTNCPDSDGDGLPDYLDTDSDGDGWNDNFDPGRLDPCNPITSSLSCPTADSDNDGVPNSVECPVVSNCVDSDGDSTPDVYDPDSDGDGVGDNTDPERLDPCIPSDTIYSCESGDPDGDGLDNITECPEPFNCPDSDSDGLLNREDPDSDNDGVNDGDDDAPINPCIPSTDVLQCTSGDADGDGLNNGSECWDENACPDQNDNDIADWLDPCAPSTDVDGCVRTDAGATDTPDAATPEPTDPCVPDVNASSCDVTTETDASTSMGTPPASQPTSDTPTSEAPPDEPTSTESVDAGPATSADTTTSSTDNESTAPPTSTDEEQGSEENELDPDHDGISSAEERRHARRFGADVDGDGVPNYLDSDSDGDGIPDEFEAGDSDHDGVPDYLQRDHFNFRGGSCSVTAARGQHSAFSWTFALALLGLLKLRLPRAAKQLH